MNDFSHQLQILKERIRTFSHSPSFPIKTEIRSMILDFQVIAKEVTMVKVYDATSVLIDSSKLLLKVPKLGKDGKGHSQILELLSTDVSSLLAALEKSKKASD